jgi:hypothetical protein
MSQIFISYSRRDKDCVYKLQRQLEAQGFKVWIDKNDIEAGEPFPMGILAGLKVAEVILICWSANSAQSEYVAKEIKEAITLRMTEDKIVIPVWMDDTPLHEDIKNIHAVPVRECSKAEIAELIQRIPERARQALGRQVHNLDRYSTLQENGAVKAADGSLYTLPLLSSWFCSATLIGRGDLVVAEHLSRKDEKPIICVVPQFLGSTEDGVTRQVYDLVTDDLNGQPFMCVHMTPNINGKIALNINEPGQALDAVNTTYNAVYSIVNGNRSLATIKLFVPMMAALAGMVGYAFDNFWHVQTYHFDRGQNLYHILADSRDL